MILILSHARDPHAMRVVELLRARGAELHLLDLSRFPREARLDLRYDRHEARLLYRERGGEVLDIGAFRAAWWRRPQPYRFEDGLDDTHFAATECDDAMAGLWSAMDARWINPPVADAAAHRKSWQLRLAVELGLAPPRTCITNSAASAERFLRSVGKAIYKPFAGDEANWRETRVFGEEEWRKLGEIRHAPVILQEFIPGIDFRVTVVGDKVFAAAIDVRDAKYPVDFRMNLENVVMRPEPLPAEVEERLHRLMDRLGLVYGAVDFRQDERDGSFRFLEINPAGQWLFVEDATGLPIAAALADKLAEFAVAT